MAGMRQTQHVRLRFACLLPPRHPRPLPWPAAKPRTFSICTALPKWLSSAAAADGFSAVPLCKVSFRAPGNQCVCLPTTNKPAPLQEATHGPPVHKVGVEREHPCVAGHQALAGDLVNQRGEECLHCVHGGNAAAAGGVRAWLGDGAGWAVAVKTAQLQVVRQQARTTARHTHPCSSGASAPPEAAAALSRLIAARGR